jgi:hypothetical protein
MMKTYEQWIEEGLTGSEANLKASVFFVEATRCEQIYIWEEWKKLCEWKEIGSGIGICVGHINKQKTKPVWVSFNFAILNGKHICFYEVTSRFSDSVMVEDFIKTKYPVKYDKGTRLAMCDAMNFHLCGNAIRENNFQ